jgi:hypothetical protein
VDFAKYVASFRREKKTIFKPPPPPLSKTDFFFRFSFCGVFGCWVSLFLGYKMEIPFDIENHLETIGNIKVCRKNKDPFYQSRSYNTILNNRLVSESIDGHLYNHQILASRYLYFNDSMLLFHQPGTGKTETSQYSMMSILASGLIKKIMIINTSKSHNIKAKATFSKIYNLERFGNRFSHLTIHEFLNKYIVFNTYSKLGRILTCAEGVVFVNPFDNMGIIFDEAHNLVPSPRTKKFFTYKSLVEILAQAKCPKIILSTATPVINEAESFEIIHQILIRSFDTSSEFPGELVSYKGATYDHINVIHRYSETDTTRGIVFSEQLCGIDNFRIYRVRPKRLQLADILEHIVSTDNEHFLHQYEAYTISSAPREIEVNPSPSNESSSDTSFTDKREVCDSCIMDQIVMKINQTKDGVIIVYMSLKEYGADIISKLLEANGYVKYDGTRKDKPTYLLYESNSSDKQRRFFEDAKRPENWDGSIIKVIIGSRVMRDGVDIHHVVQIHIALPEWHIPGLIQAWHRGIRSNGHNWLIYHRALKMVQENPTLTFKEATKLIKVDYEIFNYIIDLQNITNEEINEARGYFRLSSNSSLTNTEIARLVLQRDPSSSKIIVALEKYKEVHKLFTELEKKSIDYFINTDNNRTTHPNGNYFFTSDTRKIAVKAILSVICDKSVISSTDLIKTILSLKGSILSSDDIVSGVAEMIQSCRPVFSAKYGINMKLNLYKSRILYLTSDVSMPPDNTNPYSFYSDICKINVSSELTFTTPNISSQDLAIIPTREVNTLNKLKRVLIDVSKGGITDLEMNYLKHMTNFWGFCSMDLTPSNSTDKVLNFYILRSHIFRTSIHVKQSVRGVISPGETAIDTWVQMKTSFTQNAEIVRPIELIEKYESFDFRTIPELLPFITGRAYHPKTNGIVMVKAFRKETPLEIQPTTDFNEYIRQYIENTIGDLRSNDNYRNLIVMKKFADVRSKGRQLQSTKPIIEQLQENMSTGIFMIFFPYEKSPLNADKEEYNLRDAVEFKSNEMREAQQATQGNPSKRHQIPVIEFLPLTRQRRQEIYRMIYR